MSVLKRPIRILPVLLIVVAMLPVSCLDETLVSITHAMAEEGGDADMYLSVSVPRTYTSTGEVVTDKEYAVKSLDVLVFREGKDADAGKFFVYAACKGKLTDTERTFQVVMPVGDNLIVHVFVNCRKEMIARDFYKSRGKELDAILRELTLDADPNAAATDSLPMHGYLTKVTINKDKVGSTFTVPVVRSVAAVQVMTKATESAGADGKITLKPGIVTDAGGKNIFDLRELYVYYYSTTGRVSADAASYEPLASGADDKTRNVAKVTLPVGHEVADTRMAGTADQPRPYSIISDIGTDRLGCLYLYENLPHTSSGLDFDFTEKTTTRLVIGGVYAGDKNADDTPRVTYQRVDFADAGNNLLPVLRNHKYTISVEKVTGPGYATPDEAAASASTNVYIKLFNWADELTGSDFNSENYFNSETKTIILPRYQHAARTITVDSDVAADQWEMSFATTANGMVTVSGNAVSNDRFKVEKSADGKSLTFTALKAYSSLSGSESHDETLIIKANRLEVEYKITQTDASPDDWADGDNQNTDFGDPIPVGESVTAKKTFEFAPGNLIAVSNGRGGYTYHFAPNQGVNNEALFSWNTLLPKPASYTGTGVIWDPAQDPCRKVGNGEWRTPTESEMRVLITTNCNAVWKLEDGTETDGLYFGIAAKPEDTVRDRYVFLPLYTKVGSLDAGTYWTSTPSAQSGSTKGCGIMFECRKNGYVNTHNYSWNFRSNIRCVRDKKTIKNKNKQE